MILPPPSPDFVFAIVVGSLVDGKYDNRIIYKIEIKIINLYCFTYQKYSTLK